MFKTKKEVAEEAKPVVLVKDQTGTEVKTFDSIKEAYAFALENGYQVEIVG